jgi:hypothetical protein
MVLHKKLICQRSPVNRERAGTWAGPLKPCERGA